MKKINFLWCGLALLITGNASAQIINGSTEAIVQRSKPASSSVAEVSSASSTSETSASSPRLVSREEVEALIAAEQPAVAMTPEQKAEIDVAAKKSMRNSVKKQSVRERRDFIDVMTNAEKIQKRREALLNGQTEAEAVRAEADVEKPTFNPAQDSAMEQYLFEKAKLSEPPFMNETAPVNE